MSKYLHKIYSLTMLYECCEDGFTFSIDRDNAIIFFDLSTYEIFRCHLKDKTDKQIFLECKAFLEKQIKLSIQDEKLRELCQEYLNFDYGDFREGKRLRYKLYKHLRNYNDNKKEK